MDGEQCGVDKRGQLQKVWAWVRARGHVEACRPNSVMWMSGDSCRGWGPRVSRLRVHVRDHMWVLRGCAARAPARVSGTDKGRWVLCSTEAAGGCADTRTRRRDDALMRSWTCWGLGPGGLSL